MTKDTTKRSASGSGGETSRRKDKHVSRACNGCRRRKSKCDGVQPVCGTCLAQNHDCTWTAEEDGRRPATKAQVDAMTMEIRTLKRDKEHQDAQIDRLKAEIRRLGGNTSPPAMSGLSITIPGPPPGHQRAVSEGGQSTGFLGLPSPISHAGSSSPYAHSPVSVSSSLPSPLMPSGQFLTVPGASLYRATTPDSASSVFGSSTTDDDEARSGIMSDSDDEGGIMAPFISAGRRLVSFSDEEEPMALSGGSPLAFALAASPPRTPARSRASSFRGSFSFPASRPSTSGGVTEPRPPLSAGISSGLAAFRFPSASPSPTSPFAASPPQGVATLEHDALCPCDWNRHLPGILRESLTQPEHDQLLKEYFQYITPWQLRVVPRLFLRDMRAELSSTPGGPSSHRTSHYSPALHCAILAEASALAAEGSVLSRLEVRNMLAHAARDHAEEECGRNVLPAVNALSILAQYHLAQPRNGRLAFAVLGMAVRVALSAGLNLDLRTEEDDRERWEREWCYWSLFAQDVDMSLHIGQELTVPRPLHAIPMLPTYLFSATDNPLVPETFGHTCALMGLAARMMELLSSTSSSQPQPSLVSELQTNLAKWHADLPDSLQIHRASTTSAPGHVLVLHMAFHWITILLHRPFYSGPASREDSRKFLDDACTKLLRTLGTFERLYTLRAAPLALVQITFIGGAAALIRADSLPTGAQKRRGDAIGLAHQARDALRIMSAVWPCAERYADVLNNRADAVASGQGKAGHSHHERRVSTAGSSPVRNTTTSPGGGSYAANSPSPGSVNSPTASGGHAHSHSVPAVVVQDTNNGAMAVEPIVAVAGDTSALGFTMPMQMEQDALFGQFGVPGAGIDFNTPWSGVDPFTGTMDPSALFGTSAQGFGSSDAMLGVTGSGGLVGAANPDAGAGAALFAPTQQQQQQQQQQFFFSPQQQQQQEQNPLDQQHQHQQHPMWPQSGWTQ